ncbi:MAG TPA: alpha/beta fold hydrolase [Thermoanaerobaculia bacterium]|nr:alpha/beta fold hydrolase [Thermoanaerobaculia bacterium]
MLNSYPSRSQRLAYTETGTGEPLLLLHAFPLSKEMWEPQLAVISSTAGIAGSYRCLAPDFPGFGGSEPPAAGEVSGMDDLAADAVALLDHLGIERAVVCGLSMGGYVALALCEAWPERVRALVLADTRAGADAPEAQEKRHTTAREVEESGSGVLVDSMIPRLLGASTLAAKPGLREQLERRIALASPAGVAAAQRGMAARPDRGAVLAGLRIPVLILVGDEDILTPPEESRRMQREAPGSELVILPGAGHLSNLEQPEAFNRALFGFLARQTV